MTPSDLYKSVMDTAKERSATPLTGALVISWLLFNWRIVLVLLSTKPVEWKITYIDFLVYNEGWASLWHYILGPILAALLLLLVYPIPSVAIYRVWAFYQKKFINIEQRLRAERLVSREELASFQRQAAQDYMDSEAKIKRKDAQIEAQQGELTAFAAQVQQYELRVDELQKQINGLPPSALTASALEKYILENSFELVFNPDLPSSRNSKPILFGPNGSILDGQNKNENSWRIVGDFLELIDSAGNVHNRFYYHQGKHEFLATGEHTLPAIRGQRIYATG